MQLLGRCYDTAAPVQLEVTDGKVSRIARREVGPEEAQSWPWIAPGLIDVQINGYEGQEFSSADLTCEKVERIVRTYDTLGLARCCPTVTTQSPEVMLHAIGTIAAACQRSPEAARRIAGIHVEGPFLARADGPRGAHPLQHIRPPDWSEFERMQDAAGGRIRLLTLSPEYPESAAFIRRAVASGVIVAIGHTAADSEGIRTAVDAGARMSTHLGNGAHPLIPRHHNYIFDQLAEDRLAAGMICDGHHLPPEVVKIFVRAKTLDRCILVSDISGLAGLPPGRYPSQLCDLEILPNGKLVVAGQREIMAGASAPLGTGVANVMRFAGISLKAAIQMAVHNPARLLGLTPGGLEVGDAADLVLFDLVQPHDHHEPARLNVRATILDGTLTYGAI